MWAVSSCLGLRLPVTFVGENKVSVRYLLALFGRPKSVNDLPRPELGEIFEYCKRKNYRVFSTGTGCLQTRRHCNRTYSTKGPLS
jgi:hypothetical protein